MRRWTVNAQLALLPMSDSGEKIISLRIFIPELLRNEFKAACARQGKNMSEVVTDFARDYVAKYAAVPSSDRADAALEPPPKKAGNTKSKPSKGGGGAS
jgi:hypothetical protein